MSRRTIRRSLGVFLLLIAAGLYLTTPDRVAPETIPDHTPDLANGERMFWAGGCASCHAAPGAKGEAKLILTGGVELKTPFGVFRVPNISPAKGAGIGDWSRDDFINAMLRGTSPEGLHYYPAFPYASYQRMRVEDVIDLKGFLDTLPASDNAVADHDLAFPFSFRSGLGFWKLLYLDGKPFTPPAGADETVALGAYLAEGPGHCAECHTPRSLLGGLKHDRWMAGAPDPEGGDGVVPNITPSSDGIGSWSAADIAYFLESGFTPEFDSVGGSMTAVQENWHNLGASDREAVAAYLKSLPALPKQP